MQAFRKKLSSVHGANSLFQESVSYRKRTVPFFTGTALGGIHILHNRKKINFNYFFHQHMHCRHSFVDSALDPALQL